MSKLIKVDADTAWKIAELQFNGLKDKFRLDARWVDQIAASILRNGAMQHEIDMVEKADESWLSELGEISFDASLE